MTWNRFSEKKPSKSGDYYCITKTGGAIILPYSSVHEQFNCYDFYDDYAASTDKIDVECWYELPPKPLLLEKTVTIPSTTILALKAVFYDYCHEVDDHTLEYQYDNMKITYDDAFDIVQRFINNLTK